MTDQRKITMLASACAAAALLAGPAAAETVVQNFNAFSGSGSINSQGFNREFDDNALFDRFDSSKGTLTGVTLDYDLTSNLSGAFNFTGRGDSFAKTVAVVDWDEGNLNRSDEDDENTDFEGDDDQNDPFNLQALVSDSFNPEGDLSRFVGDGQTSVFLKTVYSLNGGPGEFDAQYDYSSDFTLTYTYDANGGENGGGNGGENGGGNGGENGGGNGGENGGENGDGGVTPPSPVPVPASLPLLACGLGMIGFMRRRRRA